MNSNIAAADAEPENSRSIPAKFAVIHIIAKEERNLPDFSDI